MEIKLNKYKELENIGYKTLFIYPDDLKNNFKGLENKISNLL